MRMRILVLGPELTYVAKSSTPAWNSMGGVGRLKHFIAMN